MSLRRHSLGGGGKSVSGGEQSEAGRRSSFSQAKICVVCEQEFKDLMGPDGNVVHGCGACWKANNYEGPVPTEYLSSAAKEDSKECNKALKKIQEEQETLAARALQERYELLNQRLHELKSKDGLQRALHGLIKQIQATGMSEIELFNLIDQDGNGELTRGELSAALRKMKISLLPSELDGILRAIDLDGDGTIDFSEFYYLLQKEGLNEGEGMQADDPRLMGFRLGDRVVIKVKLWTDEERAHRSSFDYMHTEIDAGVVMGPGVKPGTLLVKYERTGESFNMKPNQISKNSKALNEHPLHCLCDKCNPMPTLDDSDSDSGFSD
eukprot:gb/GFBE01015646.1/.p1 GENE.gb/GFBE01015646.1/~~gb/GFBE01015646.1/.p1  ORF type:complete len:324 (+),score=76.76 gb/GFBE01015646.1/:1-972(+)